MAVLQEECFVVASGGAVRSSKYLLQMLSDVLGMKRVILLCASLNTWISATIDRILKKCEILKLWYQNLKSKILKSKILKVMIFDFRCSKFSVFKNSNFRFFKMISEICPTLKSCNFFAIGPILIISDVPESSGPLLSHNRAYFPGRFHESSPNRWIGNSWFWRLKVDFGVLAWNCRYRNPRYLENEAELKVQNFSGVFGSTKLRAHRFWTESSNGFHRLCAKLVCNLVAVPLTSGERRLTYLKTTFLHSYPIPRVGIPLVSVFIPGSGSWYIFFEINLFLSIRSTPNFVSVNSWHKQRNWACRKNRISDNLYTFFQ